MNPAVATRPSHPPSVRANRVAAAPREAHEACRPSATSIVMVRRPAQSSLKLRGGPRPRGRWPRVSQAPAASTLGRDGPALRVARRSSPGLPRCRVPHRAQYHGSTDGSGLLTSSTDARRICRSFALLAQLVEHFHGKEGVAGSSPAEGSRETAATARFSCFGAAWVTTSRARGKGSTGASQQSVLPERAATRRLSHCARSAHSLSALGRAPSGHHSVGNSALSAMPDNGSRAHAKRRPLSGFRRGGDDAWDRRSRGRLWSSSLG